MHAKFLNPSNFLSGPDLPEPTTFTIKSITVEDVETDDPKKPQRKGRFVLAETTKPWLANVTNVKCLIAMFGEETDRWIGKRVTLHAERVLAFGEWTLGARITGSPDIAQAITVRVKLRKKKEQQLVMRPTGALANSAPANGRPVMPFGELKGRPIAELTDAELTKNAAWLDGALKKDPQASNAALWKNVLGMLMTERLSRSAEAP